MRAFRCHKTTQHETSSHVSCIGYKVLKRPLYLRPES